MNSPKCLKSALALLCLFIFWAPLLLANTPESAPDQRFLPLAAPSSVLLLEANGGRCTANVISATGLILTARHCLQQCLIRSGVFQLVYEQGMVSYFKTKPEKLGQAKCEVLIDRQSKEITIEATSAGFITKADEAGLRTLNPKLFDLLVADGYTSRGDFVVARVNFSEPHECLPLGKNSTEEKVVSAFSYPGETKRSDGKNSDGIQSYFTRGHIIPSISENSCVLEAKPTLASLDRLRESFDEPTAILSTLDAIYGSSGSALQNTKGEIVGILSNVYRHTSLTNKKEDEPENRFCSGSAKGLRVDQIHKLIRQIRPTLIKEIQCE